MGSIKIPTLSINNIYIYYKNIFNSIFSFWYYYYFFFFFLKIINFIILMDILLIYYKKKKKINKFLNKKIFLGTFHLFKFHEYIYIYVYIYKQIFNSNVFKNKNYINWKKFFIKFKMNYKFLIN